MTVSLAVAFCQTSHIEESLGVQRNIWKLVALESEHFIKKEQFQINLLCAPFSHSQ